MSSAKTPVSLDEIKERLENSSNDQIGTLVEKIQGISPFKDPKNRLMLPSAIRAYWIDQLCKWHKSGDLIANK